jgi:hypothetical protein
MMHTMTRLLLAIAVVLLIIPLDAQSPGPTTGTWESAPWGKLPAGPEWEAASQVSTTPEGQIVVLRRANPFFVVMTPAGDVVRTWGENLFRVAHGLRIDRKGFLWVTDNADNFVQKFSPDGKLLLTLGTRGVAGGTARCSSASPVLADGRTGSRSTSKATSTSPIRRADPSRRL